MVTFLFKIWRFLYIYLCVGRIWKDETCQKSMGLEDGVKEVLILSFFGWIFWGCRDCWIYVSIFSLKTWIHTAFYIILPPTDCYQPVINYCMHLWHSPCSHLETICYNCALVYNCSLWGLVSDARISLYLRWHCFLNCLERGYEVLTVVCSSGRKR